jgi:hypothetical protein
MSKFLLNLLLKISKAMVNSKIQFLIQKFFFRPTRPWPSWPPLASLLPQAEAHRPTRSLSPRIDSVFAEVRFPFWFAPSVLAASSSSLCQAGPGYQLHPSSPAAHARPCHHRSPATPRRPAPCLGAAEPLPPRLHFPPLIPLLNPQVFNGVKAINAGIKPRPPLPDAPPTPIKGRAPPPDFTAPLPSSICFSPRSSLACTERRRLWFCSAVARPPHRHLSSSEA